MCCLATRSPTRCQWLLVVPFALYALTPASIAYTLQDNPQRHGQLPIITATELAARHRSLCRCAWPLQRRRVSGHIATFTRSSRRKRKRIHSGEPGQAAISKLPRDCPRRQGRQSEELQGALLLLFRSQLGHADTSPRRLHAQQPQGLIEDCQCDFETVEDVNTDLAARLGDIIQLPFFRYQKIDLFRECPFWQEDGSCMNRACAVQETDEVRISASSHLRGCTLTSLILQDHIPEAWRSGTLGKVKEALGVSETGRSQPDRH